MTPDSGLQTPNSPKAYVSLGSNLGDRAGNLLLGVRGMMEAGIHVARLSSIYETEPVDVLEQPMFLNMVAELTVTTFSPEQTLARLLRVEYALGRRREILRGARTIDLDLLLYGAQQRDTEFLTLPHPRLHLRRFVLAPLAELAPGLLHPTLAKSVNQLLKELCDDSEVKRWRQE
ncbi:MAG: 2-amino-4-hydroxy-6-hydroxymethyldihydropteridine diphosphokinase [Pyrinomonadaceae bacterium]|nr:2-amino-4-hydroxy-6-hydroxymethyldihydropteridine diphosphokinase [Pyrinomonadaceae bacterium]